MAVTACFTDYEKVECTDDGDCDSDETCVDGDCEQKSNPSSCSQSIDCIACGECANAGPCLESLNACDANAQCVALNNCFVLDCASDVACYSSFCAPQFPGGTVAYETYLTCLVCTCDLQCGLAC